ncbi:hypothetical protein [Streptomyces sp. NPDC007264]|uniref:hypothetical protein n=1 Tax=Streptomyces sp. NPDC007264 TaxID=3364777 RepID=UPI0036DCCE0B
MAQRTYPPEPVPGDRVAAVSPCRGRGASHGAPAGGTVRVDGAARRITVTS